MAKKQKTDGPELIQPTHVAVELRLTAGEARTLEQYLGKFRRLLEAGVMPCPPADRESALAAVDKLLERIGEGQPAFDSAAAEMVAAGAEPAE